MDGLVRDTAERLFGEIAETCRDGAAAEAWAQVEGLGFPLALVPEARGGLGLDTADAFELVRQAGRAALNLPLAETMLANLLLAEAGLPLAEGAATVAVGAALDPAGGGWRLRVDAARVPWARGAARIVVLVPRNAAGDVARVASVPGAAARIAAGTNLAGEPRDGVIVDAVVDAVGDAAGWDAARLQRAGAALRAAALAGAIGRVVEMSVGYANEREQFGRKIGRFQAVQQGLAVAAGHAAAADAAASAAAKAFAAHALLPIAAAKVRCGEAAGTVAAIAHQVHGAIGFTREHRLHRWTRLLLAWRDEFGNEAAWSAALGDLAVDAGADGLWALVSGPATGLRGEVRAFLAAALAGRSARDRARTWTGFDAGFSRALGDRGWIAMTWPARYGGHERSAVDRYVVSEELLAAGAPVAAHWIADRQSGPLLLKVGSQAQRAAILPRIAADGCFFCIGMSEPDTGSDLAGVRTRAVRDAAGWRVNGTKLWTTYAHRSHYMILFCRTGDPAARQDSTSQFLVDLATPGITIRPIADMSGDAHFNEVVFEDVSLPADALLGALDGGWAQVMGELAFERSGPERFLSSFIVLVELVRTLGAAADARARVAVGRLVAHLLVLRHMSLAVAEMLGRGEDPSLQAAMVKDVGAVFEQELPEVARLLTATEPDLAADGLAGALAQIVLTAPSFSLRGGTREILRGIIARGLGLR